MNFFLRIINIMLYVTYDSVHLPLSGFIYTSTSRTEGGVRIPKVLQHKQSFALTRPIVKGPHPGHTLLNTTQK